MNLLKQGANKTSLTFTAAIAALLLSSCEKGSNSFSVLSENAGYTQNTVFTPRKLDVLFVVDNSGSMQTSQQNLTANFPSFINSFITKGYDFRIAVTTSDVFYGDQFINEGCAKCNEAYTQFKSGTDPKIYFIDKNTPNLTSVFTANAMVGIDGSGDERPFSSFKAALTSPLNASFRRPDAFLAVIIISDEEDFSSTAIAFEENYLSPNLIPVADYKTFLETYTGGVAGNDFSVSTISILDNNCKTALGGAAYLKIGLRYMELADLTGGTKNSLCSPFNTTLDNISANIQINNNAIFSLSKKPILSSIRVIINNILVPQDNTNGWVYNEIANTIEIKGSYKPNGGDSVKINFDPDLN